jgi:hypothetical protein
MNKDTKIRTFESGATRDTANGKFEYLGFIHPLNDYSFAKYMDSHRLQPDGSVRDSNNWWKGFGKDTIIQSLVRHVEDLKLLHSGFFVYEMRENNIAKRIVKKYKIDKLPDNWKIITIEDCCNAIRFNAEVYRIEFSNELGELE